MALRSDFFKCQVEDILKDNARRKSGWEEIVKTNLYFKKKMAVFNMSPSKNITAVFSLAVMQIKHHLIGTINL